MPTPLVLEAVLYNLTDDTIRWRTPAGQKLPRAEYDQAKHDFALRWWPEQNWVVAKWSPRYEDWLREMFGIESIPMEEIPSDVNGRLERFHMYHDNAQARERDLEMRTAALEEQAFDPAANPRKIEKALASTLKWKDYEAELADYWRHRAEAVVRHAEKMEDSGVIYRRLEGLRADLRRHQRNRLPFKYFCTYNSEAYYLVREGQVAQAKGVWEALWTDENRWIQHIEARIVFEEARLTLAGGAPQDKLGDLKPGDLVVFSGGLRPGRVLKVSVKTVRVARNADDTRGLLVDKSTITRVVKAAPLSEGV